MTQRYPPLNPLRTFEVAARHMSFTEAAEELCVTQGAVSRQVKALEDYLGFELFERHARGLSLTSSGLEYSATLAESFAQIVAATDELRLSQKETTLTIHGYNAFLQQWLLPKLPAFQMRYPNVKLKLRGSNARVDFDRDNVDVGFRYGKGKWRGMVADKVLSDQLVAVCSRAYLEEVGPLSDPLQLQKLKRYHLRRRKRDWSDWLRAAGVSSSGEEASMPLEELVVLYECVKAGHGFAVISKHYIAADESSGRIVVPFETVLERDQGYYLVMPEARRESSKVQIFRNWLLDELNTEAT